MTGAEPGLTMRAVVYREFGGPEVLHVEEIARPRPQSAEVLVRVLAVAVDYIQLHLRHGGSGRVGSRREPSYGIGDPPHVAGGTACVEVVELGPDVAGVEPGSRHLTGGLRPGACVEFAALNAAALRAPTDGRPGPSAYPPAFGPEQAAAFDYAPVAYHTLKIAAGLQPGETVLIHAAAGGTGVLAVQLAKHFGARVIATASNPDKLRLASDLGADVAINYRTEDFVAAVLDATDGLGAHVVWDPVGGDVFARSLECMAEGARLVSFGSNTFSGTGQVDFYPFWTKDLKLIGWGTRSNAEARAPGIMQELLALAAQGRLKPVVGRVLPFSEAAAAHRAIEERITVGKTVLVP